MDSTAPMDPGTPPPPGFRLSASEDWEYFTEGANNILFRYVGEHPYFKRFLLRLRKLLPGAPTTRMLFDHINRRFAPLLGSYIMRCDLIELEPDLVPALNRVQVPEYCPLDLASGDAARIEQAVFAIVNSQNSVMIADPYDDEDEDEEMGDADAPTPRQPRDAVTKELAKTLESSLIGLLTHFFRQSSIIPLLAELQHKFGTRGVFTSATLALMGENDQLPSEEEMARLAMQTGNQDPEENNIWTAMTLRDCSLFLKVWVRKQPGRGMEARIECKVGDLDLKTGDGGRAVYWRDVERKLRKGGWYVKKDVGRNCRTGQGMA